MKKLIKIAVVLIAVIIALVFLIGYKSGIPVEELKQKYTYAESGFEDIDGLNIHYRKTGAGPVLLLLHGVSSSLHTWEGWHDQLSDQFTVISIDVPGFGLTGPLPDGTPYELSTYMTILDKFLDKQGVQECYIGGNSFGGFLSYNYALHNPERIKKLVLVDPAGAVDASSGSLIMNIIENPKSAGIKLYGIPIIKEFAKVITPDFAVTESVKGVYGDTDKVTPELVTRYRELLLRNGNRGAFSQIIPMVEKYSTDTQKKMNSIQVPTLILWGAKDNAIPVAHADIMEKAIAGSQKIIYPDLGHVPMEEDPVRTATDTKNFLMEVGESNPENVPQEGAEEAVEN